MSEDETNVTELKNNKPKDAVESISNQLLEAAKKKKTEELKKAIEEVVSARAVLKSAVQKAREIEDDLKEIGNDKLDLKALEKILG